MNALPADLARQAPAVPYLHWLSPNTLRTIQNVWVCASGARYGRLVETGWVEDPEAYSPHDVSECEADDGAANLMDIGTSAGPMPLVNLLIVAAVFAERAGIDIDAAVPRKLAVTYSCGWREVRDE